MNSPQHFLQNRVIAMIGDLTAQSVDVIVNAANWTLLGGGGVDGAVHNKGGAAILAACEEIRRTLHPKGLPTGEAVITTAGNLPARFVIHTVGPIYGRHGERDAELLANTYRNSLALAVEKKLQTIAFPSISTGAFGYPKSEAAKISSLAIEKFVVQEKLITETRLVFFGRSDFTTFMKHQRFSSK